MKRRVKWKSSYKGPGDNKSRYVKLGAAAAAVLAVLAAGSLMISHFAGKDGTHQDGVIEILGEDVSHGTEEQTSEAAFRSFIGRRKRLRSRDSDGFFCV